MWYSATLDAYDVMDRVHVIARVRCTTAHREEAIETVLHLPTTFLGTGETDPRRWLEDALVAMLEAL